MYIVFIIDHIHNLMNEYKTLIFTYNSDRKMYNLSGFLNFRTKLRFCSQTINEFVLINIL